MSDLIDRNRLLANLPNFYNPEHHGYRDFHEGWNACNECFAGIIRRQPTAYSKERIPRTPDLYGDGYSDGEPVIDMYACPNCGEGYELEYVKYKYCPNCGQALDWDSVLDFEEGGIDA